MRFCLYVIYNLLAVFLANPLLHCQMQWKKAGIEKMFSINFIALTFHPLFSNELLRICKFMPSLAPIQKHSHI